MPAHHLHDEHLGRRVAHRFDIQGRFAYRHGNVLRYRAEPRTAVRERQIVVDGLWNADAGHRIAQPLAELRDLVRGVLGIAAPVVEKVTDVVSLEDIDQAPVVTFVRLETLEFVAA